MAEFVKTFKLIYINEFLNIGKLFEFSDTILQCLWLQFDNIFFLIQLI
jgi:hypothetical protein